MSTRSHAGGSRARGGGPEGGGAPLAEVARVLAEEAGISLGDGLDRALGAGLAGAAAALGAEPDAIARRVVQRDPEALAALVEHAVVLETAFWRHPEQLAAVAREVAARPGPARIWSAGCATGEEPYSVAVALLEAGRDGRGDAILATDVSARALDAARAATYGHRALRRLPAALAARWLETGAPRRVAPRVRALVAFERHNLLRDPPPPGAPFDVVLCRNVLIYFAPETAAAVLHRLAGAVAPGGLLVLGPVELPLAQNPEFRRESPEFRWEGEGGATVLRRSL